MRWNVVLILLFSLLLGPLALAKADAGPLGKITLKFPQSHELNEDDEPRNADPSSDQAAPGTSPSCCLPASLARLYTPRPAATYRFLLTPPPLRPPSASVN